MESKLDNLNSGDYRMIKNPFVCKAFGDGVRLSLSKPQHLNKQGNTDRIEEVETEEGNLQMVNHIDDKLSYTFGANPIDPLKQISEIDKYDYVISPEILNEKSNYKEHKDPLPLSFLQIDNEEDGLIWYAKHYPKIPEELLPIIARYHWGEPITKKNEKKKIQKKLQKQGLKIENKKVSVVFD